MKKYLIVFLCLLAFAGCSNSAQGTSDSGSSGSGNNSIIEASGTKNGWQWTVSKTEIKSSSINTVAIIYMETQGTESRAFQIQKMLQGNSVTYLSGVNLISQKTKYEKSDWNSLTITTDSGSIKPNTPSTSISESGELSLFTMAASLNGETEFNKIKNASSVSVQLLSKTKEDVKITVEPAFMTALKKYFP